MISIQNKIWLLAAVVLFFMASIWITFTFYNQKTQHQYNEILQRYLRLSEVTGAGQELITNLNNYLLHATPEHEERITHSQQRIRQAKHEMITLSHADNDFALTNYVNLIDSLLEATNRSLMYYGEQEQVAYMEAFAEANRISKYLSDMSLTLIDTELRTSERLYRGIIGQSEELTRLGIWLLLLITLLLMMFTYWFSRSITKPVKQLTQAAHQLSYGRFDLQIQVDSNDEIAFLARMFDRMRRNINNLISEMREKAELEKELQQNKILLQETQLLSLQSQINPHFLFNTLDTLSKKAYMEGSEETSDLLVNVANLLRYNLKRLDRKVTLFEEVDVLKQYIEIQKARFTERLQFQADVDESCFHVLVPGLTLQPIVENAVIHAVEPSEDGGTIHFRVRREGQMVKVEISDDGPGMKEDQIKQILEEETFQTEGHSTGIGISNVIKRLRLFYGIHDVVEIESSPNHGTRVTLNIPEPKGGDLVGQAVNRR